MHDGGIIWKYVSFEFKKDTQYFVSSYSEQSFSFCPFVFCSIWYFLTQPVVIITMNKIDI